MTAVHTTRGGCGRLSAATTNHNSSKAGAMAEATMAPGTSSVRIITHETRLGAVKYQLIHAPEEVIRHRNNRWFSALQ